MKRLQWLFGFSFLFVSSASVFAGPPPSEFKSCADLITFYRSELGLGAELNYSVNSSAAHSEIWANIPRIDCSSSQILILTQLKTVFSHSGGSEKGIISTDQLAGGGSEKRTKSDTSVLPNGGTGTEEERVAGAFPLVRRETDSKRTNYKLMQYGPYAVEGLDELFAVVDNTESKNPKEANELSYLSNWIRAMSSSLAKRDGFDWNGLDISIKEGDLTYPKNPNPKYKSFNENVCDPYLSPGNMFQQLLSLDVSGPWGDGMTPPKVSLYSLSMKVIEKVEGLSVALETAKAPGMRYQLRQKFKAEVASLIAETMFEIRKFYSGDKWLKQCKGSVPSTLSLKFYGM